MPRIWIRRCVVVLVGLFTVGLGRNFFGQAPMRPLPVASERALYEGPSRFVDASRGDDAHDGSQAAPWRTLSFALRQLEPGETLYLRGGVYYERPAFTKSGTAEAPITIRSFPDELAIIDGGLREFFESPATSWEPLEGGAEHEYVSTRTYVDLDQRRIPRQFLPGAWEPMWGIEDERPLALGHFADTMIPLHGYRLAVDLRSSNELWLGGKHEMRDIGIYCGPGLWYNRATGRIHIRLAHHRLAASGIDVYRGETDPRRMPLVIAAGFGEEVLRIHGVQHVRLQDLVLRGATGSPMIHVYGSQQIALDHLTVFGGFPGLLVNATQQLRVTNCAFRGLAAPWSSRASMKYRGTASYQIVLQDNQPTNEDLEFAWCEFTDDHDFAFLREAKNLQFHHNFVDNFNDDGLECGPKLRWHTIYIYQNRIGRCLIPLAQHEIQADESPLDHNPGSGVYLYRNVFDMRGGTFSGPPRDEAAASAAKTLRAEGHLAGDHGSPTWPVMFVYHNTFLRETPVFRDYYLFGLGAQGMRNTERDVFNNIFVQWERAPGVGIVGVKEPPALREGGNLLWSPAQPELSSEQLFQKFRSTPLFASSREQSDGGWTAHDVYADPQFVVMPDAPNALGDFRLRAGSPAINAGRRVPDAWPDPLRSEDDGVPDIGALPHGVSPDGVGVDGRVPLFGERAP